MKRLLLAAASLISLTNVFAQNTFFEKTCYRGAFAPAPAQMWTDSWTEWDPINKIYPAPTMTVTGDITTNTTWSTGQVVLLSSQCYVKNNSVLTIQPGVIVRGDLNVQGASIIVTKGSQLVANGTPANPIVFTSNGSPGAGNRTAGDWGGIILLGKANNNTGGPVNIEGLPISADSQYGVSSGADDNDNSGSLKYVRIEFAGFAYQQDKEINSLTMGAVGRGTTIDYVQCSFGLDDAFEWFGGTVNAKHLVSYRCLDDDFDTDFGYSGNVQFCLAVRDPEVADNPSISTSEIFESDNNGGGSQTTLKTSAIFSNVTAIGPLRGVVTATTHAGYRRGARIRRHSELKIHNSIFMDNKTRGLFIDGAACEANADAGLLKFKHNILAGYGQRATEQNNTIINTNTFVIANGCDTLKSSANILTTPYNYTTPDYRPSAGSIALAGASFTDAVLAAATGTSAYQVMAAIPSSVCIGNGSSLTSYSFSSSSTITSSYCSLSWSVSPGIAISNSSAVNPTFTVSTIGTFSVYLMVTDADGAKSVMRTITTNTCLDVSVKEAEYQIGSVILSPNPAKDEVTVLINTPSVTSLLVSVYDITGKRVLTTAEGFHLQEGENRLKIDTSNLENGIYFVNLVTPRGKETVKLLVNN